MSPRKVRDLPYMRELPEINGMKVIAYRCFGYKVMTVLVHKVYEDAWSVYIGAVPGNRHIDEIEGVVKHGYSLSRAHSKVIYSHHSRMLTKKGIPHRI